MRLHYSKENPITRLLDRRQSSERPRSIALVTALLILIPISVSQPPLALKLALGLGGLAYALLRAASDYGHLGAWRKGRSLEAMLLSQLSPEEIVDGVAFHGLAKTARAAAAIGLVGLVGGAFWCDEDLLRLGLMEPVFLVALVFALEYLAMAGPDLCGLVGLLLLILGFLIPGQGPILSLVVLLGLGQGARHQAVTHLLTPGLPESEKPTGPAPSGGEARLWNDNPIVVRELRRQARWAGPGRLKVWSQRHGSFLLMMVLLLANLFLRHLDAYRSQVNAIWVLLVMLALQTLRAALTGAPAVVQEREAGTLEPLALSGLSPEQLVDGWAQVSWRPRMVENLLAIPVALGLVTLGVYLQWLMPTNCTRYPIPPFETLPEALAMLVPLGLMLLVFTVAGAYVGLLASTTSASQGQAVGRAVMVLLLLAGVSLPVLALTGPYGPALMGVVVALASRALALAGLRQKS